MEVAGHVHYNSDDIYEQDETNHWMICDDCDEIYGTETHNESDWMPSLEPTCTTPGHSEWKNCTVCGYVIVAQESIPEKGHVESLINAKEPTCSEEGYTGDTICTVCDAEVCKGQVISMKPHTERVLNAKESTCCEEGYTGDRFCTVCDTEIGKGQIVPLKPHTEKIVNDKEPTDSEEGYSGDVVCEVCDTVIQKGEIINPNKKNTVIDTIADFLGITSKQVLMYGGISLGGIVLIILIMVVISKIRRL